ncbi:hypothetical protein HYT51_03305 [Candidatus Woesearchaeota archaeon]|nr:hypothetical protein [Candidatus Woesearchaeota archaeon]
MKHLTTIILILMLLGISYVNAGRIFHIGELEKTEIVTLNEKDGFDFVFKGTHLIVVNQINKNNVKVSVFPNTIEESTRFPLTEEINLKIDLDKDEVKDLQLDLEDFDTENKIATLKLTPLTNETIIITDQGNNQVTGESIDKVEAGNNTLIGFSLMIGIIIIGLLLFLYFSKSLHFHGLFKKR